MKRSEVPLILAAWLAAVAAIRPRGNFPLNDDWDFAIATWRFARTGQFHFTPFTAVSLRAQVLWGALWTRLFGESFEVLRASTIVLAALAIVIVHRTIARAGGGAAARVIGTSALAFHPIFIWSACTYMTEIPFVCASAAALYCFVRAVNDERAAWLIAGCAAVALSCFVRQTGVAMLLGVLLFIVWQRRSTWRRDAAILVAALLAFAAVLMMRPQWLAGSVEELGNHFMMWRESSFRLPQQLALVYHYSAFNAQNAALFSLPLIAAFAFGLRRRRDMLLAAAFALLLLPRVQWLINEGHPMPYFANPYCCDIMPGNVLSDFTLGPLTLSDVWRAGHPYPFHLTAGGRLALTYLSVVAGALLLLAAVRALQRAELPAARLAAPCAVAGTCALFGSGLYVDRYALDSAWAVVIFLALLAPFQLRRARFAAAAVLIVVALFDVFAVGEYFAWNRARWRAVDDLRARGVAVQRIDGGAEVLNWYEIAWGSQRQRRQIIFSPMRPVVIAFGPLDGYHVVARYPYSAWLGLRRGDLLVLEAN